MADEHGPYCRKEKEIAEMHTDLQLVKKVVMGNGNEGLIVTVPKLAQSVDRLNDESIPDLKRGINGFVKYQQSQEGKQAGTEETKKRNRWVIGILITALLMVAGALVATIHLLVQANAGG